MPDPELLCLDVLRLEAVEYRFQEMANRDLGLRLGERLLFEKGRSVVLQFGEDTLVSQQVASWSDDLRMKMQFRLAVNLDRRQPSSLARITGKLIPEPFDAFRSGVPVTRGPLQTSIFPSSGL